MSAHNVLTFLHLLAAFWYVAGLVAVQVPLSRAWNSTDLKVRVDSLEEASHCQGVLLVPGAIAGIASGLFLWALDNNLLTTGWLLVLEVLYLVTLLLLLPLIGMGLRRLRLAGLQARRKGKSTPELEEAMSDNAPVVLAGIATLLVPIMAFFSVFQPF